MQIGPRIRIGGTVGKIGQKIKKALPSVPSMILSNAIPGGSFIGSALNHSVKEDFQKGATNTPLAMAGVHAFGGGSGDPVGGDAGGTAAPTDPGGIEGAIAKIPGGQEILDAVKSGKVPLTQLFDFLKQHGGDILAGANVADAAWRQLQADKYAGKAFDLSNNSYNERAPLRTAGIAGMLNPGADTPDLSALRTIAGAGSGNPFAKALPMAGPQAVGNHGPGSPVPMPLGGYAGPQTVNNIPSRLVGVPPLPGSNGTPSEPPVIPSRLVGVPPLAGSGQ